MNPPGRCLQKNYNTNLWSVVADSIAREKVCQALRDAVGAEDASSSSGSKIEDGNSARESEQGADAKKEDTDSKLPALPRPGPPVEPDKTRISTTAKHNANSAKIETDQVLATETLSTQNEFGKEANEEKVCNHFESVPPEMLPDATDLFLPELFTSSNELFSPPKTICGSVRAETTTSGAALVTPMHQEGDKIQDVEFNVSDIEANVYDYIPHNGLNDDFDLFDGELLKSSSEDEVLTKPTSKIVHL